MFVYGSWAGLQRLSELYAGSRAGPAAEAE